VKSIRQCKISSCPCEYKLIQSGRVKPKITDQIVSVNIYVNAYNDLIGVNLVLL
jgi:hypothetical protein